MTPISNGHQSDSPNAVTVVVEHVCENIARPIDPARKEYARLVELRRALKEANANKTPPIEPINVELSDGK